jgi:hypothetical protein
METRAEKDRIKELSIYDIPDTVSKPDGYCRKEVPEATADNMEVLLDKINELTKAVNKLTL